MATDNKCTNTYMLFIYVCEAAYGKNKSYSRLGVIKFRHFPKQRQDSSFIVFKDSIVNAVSS